MGHQAIAAAPDPQRLLIRGVNWLGDAVMTTPAIYRIRERFPNTQITLLTDERLADLWSHQALINRILVCQRAERPWLVARRLKTEGFDAAVILPNSPRSALESWLAGIPRRIGYSAGWRGFLLTEAIRFPRHQVRARSRGVAEVRWLASRPDNRPPRNRTTQHQIFDYLHLAGSLGASPEPVAPRLEVGVLEIESALAGVRHLMRERGLANLEPTALLLGVNVSAAYGPAKRWPLERFAAVLKAISCQVPNCVWLAFGAESDAFLNEQLEKLAQCPVLNLAGKTSLRQLMALLKSCQVLLCNDSGPMHVAAALGTPVIVPFGSTSPQLTGPGLPGDSRHVVLQSPAPCAPCFRRTCPIDFRCMTGISPEQVTEALLPKLGVGPATLHPS